VGARVNPPHHGARDWRRIRFVSPSLARL